jgi:hypothetical protein
MKVKNILILFNVSAVLFLSSCVRDFGNYEYQDPDDVLPVIISGMKDTSILKGEYLVLDPDVKISGDPSQYNYSWYVMPAVTAGFLPTKTVMGNAKQLNYPITLAVGEYFLNLTVTDSIRDIYARKEVKLRVKATEIGAGWFVLKDINDETDFDYIANDGKIYPDVLLTLADPVGSRLKGKAVRIEYQGERYYHQETNDEGKVTTLANQSVYHILSDEDIKVFNSKDLRLFKNQQDVFYTPTVCRPQNIRYMQTNLFLVNDGTISSIYGMMQNFGKVAPKVGFYTLHSDLLVHGRGSAMGFDVDNRTFYHVDAYSAMMTFREQEGAISTTNMNADLLNIIAASEEIAITAGFAVMKNPDKEEYYLATLRYYSSNAYPIAVSEENPSGIAFDTVPQGCKMPVAPVKAAPYSGNFVYFADGNKLSVYRNASGFTNRESLLKEFPAGETISYMTHKYDPYGSAYNYLVVLTNSANGWKLYVFDVIGLGNPEISPDPRYTYQGTGNARFVMFRQW